MTYQEWFEEHAKKHADIVKSLPDLSKDELIAYFDFDHMKVAHPDFCPLYPKDQKCHDMEKLNCYFCACMHFRFDDNGIREESGKVLYSYCSIESKNSARFEDKQSIHQDCSNCKVPHKQHVIEKYFSRDWKEVMKACNLKH
ncbi:MAG TPA: hypothetical protein ENL02_02110 [Epsilonproteobacteria bacterium]|nr:hypothetical protein [Campylobacterota bacterium]